MPQRPGGVLISREEIAARVVELGQSISREHGGGVPLLVGVLKGAAVFMADLIRAIPSPVAIYFMAVSSYGPATRSSGAVCFFFSSRRRHTRWPRDWSSDV